MPDANDERDQLIADLLEEAHGLRMKLEEFSLFTESKVAEHVVDRKNLARERDEAVHHHELARHDLGVLRRRQTQMQDELVAANSRLHELEATIARLTRQRDNARRQLAALRSSRAVRAVAALRRMWKPR